MGQPLPPLPRHPMVHLWVAPSQTRPLAMPPQSLSASQPQVPAARHLPPLPVGRQAVLFCCVHSTHTCAVVEQTSGRAQPASLRHWTHWCGVTLVSHAVVGSTQSPLIAQPPAGLQVPTPPLVSLQVWPTGQPLRPGAALHPGTQMPAGPLQTTPDVLPPQSPSPPPVFEQPQIPRSVRQRGFEPPHRSACAAVHSVQAPASAPVVWQYGRVGSAQLGAPSAVHGMQVCVAGAQNGVGPEQSLLVTQPTQTPPPATSHSGRAVGQAVLFVAEH